MGKLDDDINASADTEDTGIITRLHSDQEDIVDSGGRVRSWKSAPDIR